MAHRFLTWHAFVWLALAWGQASMLGSQQIPPANPAPPAAGAPAVETAPPEAGDFHKDSLSHLRLQRGGRTFDVYLFAPDQSVDVVGESYCGGAKGARQFSGHFQLLSVAGNTIVSRLELDPGDSFVENKPHDGARLFREPKSGQDLVVLYQYGNCASESVQFFSADPAGRLFMIPFLDRDGRTWRQVLTGPGGAIPEAQDGTLGFCSYAKYIGYSLCETYAFDGANFVEAAKWMARDAAAPIKGLNDAAEATRALYDFLSVLSVNGYSAAAYYVDFSAQTPGAPPPTATLAQRAAFLENYCTVKGGQCLMPMTIERNSAADVPGTMMFEVSFQTADFEPFKIGSRSSFDFRVAKIPRGFKVLDLPPQIPLDRLGQ